MDNSQLEVGVGDELLARLDEIAHAPLLLVASDFDGTIAPIVQHPARAEADRETVVALKSLSSMPQTNVAIISGRALSDLASRVTDAEELHLVGSHGSEFEAGVSLLLSGDGSNLLKRVREAALAISAKDPGFHVEDKPASVAFHYRNANVHAASEALEEIIKGPGSWPNVHLRYGKMVLELSVIDTNKGVALSRLRQRVGARAVLFMGDDDTDEDAFATMGGPDIAVKVGAGDSKAPFRAASTMEVSQILARVAERRADWLAGSHAVPIERHSILSDQRSIALMDSNGKIVWLCLPRIDSSAVFAEILGGPSAGYFEVRPAENTSTATQRYIPNTLVLETSWPKFTVTDYLDVSDGRALQRAGRSDLIRVVQGSGPVRITFAPRLDFGRMETKLRAGEAGVEVEGSIDPFVLFAPGLKWQIVDEGRHQTAVAEINLSPESPLVLELRYGTASLAGNPRPEHLRRARTQKYWSGWASTLNLPSVAPELVCRSALTLKALCYGPTGAIAAAATTSLPEYAGGVRNWDYRFCWPRDAAMSAAALISLGATEPALRFLDWVLAILDQTDQSALIAPVYTVAGGHLGPEAEIAELSGYRGSRPVRVGNLAAQQIQLDVCGPVADLVAQLAEHGEAISPEHWRMLASMVKAIEQRWREPDHGIWEVRRPRQHHVHSKVMCWQTIERALRVANYLGRRQPDWIALGQQIAEDILANGWKADCNAFCGTYDDTAPDASALVVGLSGLLPHDDERVLGTLQFVDRNLRHGPTVYRYRYDDGLPGSEGGFHLCSSWLIESFARAGQHDTARQLFEQYCQLAGPTGLMSEQFDPQKKCALGNFPQAYSHLGLINAAHAVAKGPHPQ